MLLHEHVEESMALLYKSLDIVGMYKCGDENTTSLMCSFLTMLKTTIEAYDSKGDMSDSKENIHSTKNHQTNKIKQQIN